MAGRRALRLRALGIALGAGLLAVLACELALRALGPDRHPAVWPPGSTTVFRPAPGRMPGIEGESRFEADELGLRSAGVPAAGADVHRVLALGGSTTECLYLDQSEAWPARLAAGLGGPERIWIANAGKSGLTSRDHVAQLELLLELESFDAVLLMTGVNDLMLRLSRPNTWRPWPRDEAEARGALLPRAFERLPDAGGPWWKRTALWDLARRTRSSSGERIQDSAGSRYDAWRANRAAAPALRTELPDMEPALAELEGNLHWILEQCEARGIEVVLLTQPAVWSTELSDEMRTLLWMGWVGESQDVRGIEYYAVDALRLGMEAYNERVAEVARSKGLGLIDLRPMNGAEAWFYDDVHFNEAGAEEAARIAENRLRSLGW